MDIISSFVLAGVATLMVIAFAWFIICIVGAIADFFDKDARQKKKIHKEFGKLFGGRPCYSRIGKLKDEDYEKHHMDPKYVRYCMTEFAVRYIDPETLNYNDTYHNEWG